MRLRKTIVTWLALVVVASAAAQNPRLLRFDAPDQNLGEVKEVEGVVKLRYAYTNVADRPVTLLDIHTQCGCAKPLFDRKPIQPGAQGVVEVMFDPKDRLGDFSIGLTVVSDNGNYRKFNTLILRGSVISRVPEAEIRYPYSLSPELRADLRSVGMRQLQLGDAPRVREVRLFNTSARPLKLSYRTTNPNLSLSGPTQIDAEKEAVIRFVLDPRSMPTGKFAISSYVQAGDRSIPIEVKGLILAD